MSFRLKVVIGVVLAAFAACVAAGDSEWLIQRDGAEVVDLHVPGHGEDVERAVELAHGFVEQGRDKAAVEIAGRVATTGRWTEMG